MANTNKIKICSLNCNGLLMNRRRNIIFDRFKSLEIDIIFLQEIFSNKLKLCREWADSLQCHGFFSLGTGASKGVAILIKKSLNCKIDNFIHDYYGRLVNVDCTIYSNRLRLLSIYVPVLANEQIF